MKWQINGINITVDRLALSNTSTISSITVEPSCLFVHLYLLVSSVIDLLEDITRVSGVGYKFISEVAPQRLTE